MKRYTITLIFASAVLLLITLPAIAAPTHHVALTATLCKSGQSLNLKGEAISWAQDASGENPSVNIDMKVVYANNSVEQWTIATGAFTPGGGYRFSFGYQGMATDALTVTVLSSVTSAWGDGSTQKPVNQTTAIFTGDCVTDTKLTPTPDPPTATSTPTLPPATPTQTPTATATATIPGTTTPAPTATQVWDKSSVTVIGECRQGVPTFLVTNIGESMTAGTEWTLLSGDIVAEWGEVLIAAGETVTFEFPGYKSKLRMIVTQRPGHPGFGAARADVDAGNCTTAPTSDAETLEPDSFDVIRLGTEIIDSESGTVYDVWWIDCHVDEPSSVTLDIHIAFSDGSEDDRSGKYCNVKIYVPGVVTLLEVVSAIAEPESVDFGNVYLPLVVK